MALLVNLFGGPCTRKSTTAIRVAGELMRRGINCDYAHEYAKKLTYEGRAKLLQSNQLYTLAKQEKIVKDAYDVQDVVITDSPFIMGLAYYNRGCNTLPYQTFFNLAVDLFNCYQNMNYLLLRSDDCEYNPVGRINDPEEAKKIDEDVFGVLRNTEIGYHIVNADEAYERILSDILYFLGK